jgi:hypothetical protein
MDKEQKCITEASRPPWVSYILWGLCVAMASLWLSFISHIRDGHPNSVMDNVQHLKSQIMKNEIAISHLQSNNRQILINVGKIETTMDSFVRELGAHRSKTENHN